MPSITLNLTLKKVFVRAKEQTAYGIDFEALGPDSRWGRRLASGDYLADLIGHLTLRCGHAEESPSDKSLGMLRYVAADKEYRQEESYVIDLTLPPDRFAALEAWVRQGTSHLCVDLDFAYGSGIDDGHDPDIALDETWNNIAAPEVPIRDATFTLAARCPSTGKKYQVYSPGEHGLPARLLKPIEAQISAAFGEKSDAEMFETGYRKVWLTRNLAYEIAYSVANDRIAHPHEAASFEEHLREAFALLESVRGLLNPLSDGRQDQSYKKEYRERFESEFKKAKIDHKSWVWCHRSVKKAIEGGEKELDYWPVNKSAVSDLCYAYLRKPWMESPALEFLLVDALIYQTTLDFGEAMSRSNWGKVKRSRRLWWEDAIAWSFRFTLATAVGLAAAITHDWWAGVLAGTVLWAVLKHLLGYGPINTLRRKEADLLWDKLLVNRLFVDPRISPEFIRQRLFATANEGVLWPAAAIALVEHAAKRNSVAWVS